MSNLKELIKKTFTSVIEDDQAADNQITYLEEELEKLGYNIQSKEIGEHRWYSDGDEEKLEDFVVELKVDASIFILKVEQTRTDSSDPYYFEPEIVSILTKEEFEGESVLLSATFTFKGIEISIFSNGKAKIADVWFKDTESAINSI